MHKINKDALPLPLESPLFQQFTQWLYQHGRHIHDMSAFSRALAHKLVELGIPANRIHLSIHLLGPETVARGYTWFESSDQVTVYSPPHGIDQTPSYVDSPMEYIRTRQELFRCKLMSDANPKWHPLLKELQQEGYTDYIAIPVFMRNEGIDGLFMATRASSGFSDEHLVFCQGLATLLAPLMEVAALESSLHILLDTYIGQMPRGQVLSGKVQRGDSETIDAAIWFSDLRNFTSMTEQLSNDSMLATLNCYFETVAAMVQQNGGEILRFIGDAMLIVFPARTEHSLKAACNDAITAAKKAFAAFKKINQQRYLQSLPLIEFGIGLHCGKVVYGNVGAPNRMDFTVMGSAVNRAARIEQLTTTTGYRLLFSHEFAQLISDPSRNVGEFMVKGIKENLDVYTLIHNRSFR